MPGISARGSHNYSLVDKRACVHWYIEHLLSLQPSSLMKYSAATADQYRFLLCTVANFLRTPTQIRLLPTIVSATRSGSYRCRAEAAATNTCDFCPNQRGPSCFTIRNENGSHQRLIRPWYRSCTTFCVPRVHSPFYIWRSNQLELSKLQGNFYYSTLSPTHTDRPIMSSEIISQQLGLSSRRAICVHTTVCSDSDQIRIGLCHCWAETLEHDDR